MNSKDLGKNMAKAVLSQSKIAALSLGIDIQLTPEETEAISIGADLSPIADGQQWKAGLNLTEGTIVTYYDENYIVLQGHISQVGWTPKGTPALFKAIQDPYTAWAQPAGAHDAYMKGDMVTHKNNKWVSNIDNNVWEPGVYGWDIM